MNALLLRIGFSFNCAGNQRAESDEGRGADPAALVRVTEFREAPEF